MFHHTFCVSDPVQDNLNLAWNFLPAHNWSMSFFSCNFCSHFIDLIIHLVRAKLSQLSIIHFLGSCSPKQVMLGNYSALVFVRILGADRLRNICQWIDHKFDHLRWCQICKQLCADAIYRQIGPQFHHLPAKFVEANVAWKECGDKIIFKHLECCLKNILVILTGQCVVDLLN